MFSIAVMNWTLTASNKIDEVKINVTVHEYILFDLTFIVLATIVVISNSSQNKNKDCINIDSAVTNVN